MPRGARHLPLLCSLLALGCEPALQPSAVEEPVPCAFDVDCPHGRLCSSGSCVLPVGPGSSECHRSDDCFDDPDPHIQDLYWDGDDLVCTIDPAGCTGDPCGLRRICAPQAEGATRPGAVRCASDEQCLGGYCVAAGEDRVCLRSCASDADCPFELDAAGTRFGTGCALVELDGATTLACVPLEAGRTLCRHDCDCATSDACDPLAPGAQRCVFQPGRPRFPLCTLPPAAPGLPVMFRCGPDSECEGGACLDPCDPDWARGAKNFCHDSIDRCTRPCSEDADCPQRTACRAGARGDRVGSWALVGQDPGQEGRDLLYCRLPSFGCNDELDCTGFTSGGEAIISWDREDPRCAVEFEGSSGEPRLLTLCVSRDPALAPPGTCCAAHEECDSGVCVPPREGIACASGVCSVPCADDSVPDGVRGGADDRDRCGELAPLSPFFAGSLCEPLLYERQVLLQDGTGFAFTTTLHACR